MQERKVNRKYDKQFKEEAVRLATEEGRKVTEVARSLGIHENLLRTWKRKYQEDPAGSFPGKGHLKPQDEEFRKLQKENHITTVTGHMGVQGSPRIYMQREQSAAKTV